MRRVRHSSKVLAALQAFVLVLLAVGVALAADSLAVYVATPTPGQRSIYELRFSLTAPLPRDAVFEIQFPPDLSLDQVKVVGSQTIDGGFRFRKRGNTLIVERTGRGHVVPAGKKVDLKIANLRNPRQLGTGLQVRLVVRRGGQAVADVTSPVRWAAPPKVLAE